MKYIALDTETGGTTPECSLLSVYLQVLDDKLQPLGELDLFIKPNDDLYKCTAEALGVNHINLIEHDKIAVTEGKASQMLYAFLQEHNPKGVDKLIPIGHNVAFDIKRVQRDLMKSWDTFVSYRKLDTGSIAQFMKVKGLLPESVSGSLGSLMTYFNIPVQGVLHTAKSDTLGTVDVLRALLKL